MADETLASGLTPGQVAANETARQAVMLIFGLVTAMIVMKMQQRMVEQMQAAQHDPDAARSGRMREAKRLEAAWSKAGTWIAGLAMLAYRQADKARASYEKDRA